ncbi:hypothetical protein POTOM_059985 [Populus tomentosa]|uniref:Ninja-family protein n=1 Tax=Populus tomentosa TaxID=118781 RepID=A0A8X8BW32_POPTO|nr:hypothetical protein POTOM_059985 [Populus tomentosa]
MSLEIGSPIGSGVECERWCMRKSLFEEGITSSDWSSSFLNMEDENGLELSLGLGCCGSSSQIQSGGLWVSSSNRSAENDEEKDQTWVTSVKLLFDELNNQKKHKRDAHHTDLHDKKSHILITTEDGSTAENEDVAESEVEGSTSRLASHHDNGAKQFIGVGGPPEATKEIRGFLIQVLWSYKDMGCSMFPASYAGRALSNAEKQNDGLKISQAMQAIARNLTEVEQHEGSTLGQAKGDGKQLIVEVGSSSHTKDDAKGSTMNLRPNDAPKQSTAETLCFDFSAIKPGIGPAMKFGGCGSYPSLPWVSTTLPGPNGRTISGVTYKYSANQIRIVCACHGSHMSPEEFVRHASEENANPGNGNGLATFPGNQSCCLYSELKGTILSTQTNDP